MIKLENYIPTTKIPLGLYKIYWVCGQSSLALVAQDARGNRYFHCVNWTVVPDASMSRLDEREADIIKMEKIDESS